MATSASGVTFERDGGRLTIRIAGDLDAATVPDALRQVMGALEGQVDGIVVDLSRCGFCDSSGIMLLFRVSGAAEANGATCVVTDPTGPVRKVLELADPNGVLVVEPRQPGG